VLARPKNGTINAGAAVAGSSLQAAKFYASSDYFSGNNFMPLNPNENNPAPSLTGTWRNMGGYAATVIGADTVYPKGYWALFLRIA